MVDANRDPTAKVVAAEAVRVASTVAVRPSPPFQGRLCWQGCRHQGCRRQGTRRQGPPRPQHFARPTPHDANEAVLAGICYNVLGLEDNDDAKDTVIDVGR